MATAQQVPGELNIEVGAGDDWSYLVDFDIDLTGYTFAATVEYYTGSATTTLSMSVANTDLANGQITLSLTDTQITTIGTAGLANKWYLIWTTGSTSRRILAGTFKVIGYA